MNFTQNTLQENSYLLFKKFIDSNSNSGQACDEDSSSTMHSLITRAFVGQSSQPGPSSSVYSNFQQQQQNTDAFNEIFLKTATNFFTNQRSLIGMKDENSGQVMYNQSVSDSDSTIQNLGVTALGSTSESDDIQDSPSNHSDELTCPLCNVTLRTDDELARHFNEELNIIKADQPRLFNFNLKKAPQQTINFQDINHQNRYKKIMEIRQNRIQRQETINLLLKSLDEEANTMHGNIRRKKGPLSRIWLAAHWDKKLTRAQVFETNISSSVEAILEPKLKMALRTSGHLLLGVVKIFSKKTKYLWQDCSEAFVKIKMAFRPGMVDLQEDANREAAITLPENIPDFEQTIAELNEMNMGSIGINQSRPEDITLREDFGEIQLGRQDDDFGDSSFDETGREIMRDGDNDLGYTRPSERMSIRADFGVEDSGILDNIGSIASKKSMHISGIQSVASHRDMDIEDDDNFGGDFLPHDDASNDSFGEEMILPHGDLFGDPSAQEQLDNIANEIVSQMDKSKWNSEKKGSLDDSIASVMFPPTPGPSAMAELNAALGIEQMPIEHGQQVSDNADLVGDFDSKKSEDNEKKLVVPPLKISNLSQIMNTPGFKTDGSMKSSTPSMNVNKMLPPDSTTKANYETSHTTLISNDSTAFALPPIDASSIVGMESRRGKRKRRLIIDDQKTIPSEVMKIQMQDTNDITAQLDLAPPTKKLMLWKETGSVDKLFALPGRFLPCRLLQRLFVRNLITQHNPEDNGEEIFKKVVNKTISDDNSAGTTSMQPDKGDQISRMQEEIRNRQNKPLDIIQESFEDTNNSSSIRSSDKISNHGQSSNPYMTPQPNMISTPHTSLEDHQSFCHPSEPRSQFNTPGINPYSDALEDHRLDTGLAGPHGQAACSDYEPDMGAPIDDDDDDIGHHDDYMNPLTSTYKNDDDESLLLGGESINPEFLAFERELADCDNEANAEVMAVIKTASDLTANVTVTTSSKVEFVEEKRLEKRSKVMLRMLRARMNQGPMTFQSICIKNSKKQVASKFYTMLLLRKQCAVHLSQENPFSDIIITQGDSFVEA